MDKLGLYIHVPFCKSKCRYCDFRSFPHSKEETVDAYLTALIREIGEESQTAEALFGTKPTVDTVYFGGGTPTILTAVQWERLTEAIFSCFSVDTAAEITAECNPATADREYFQALRVMGINRLSIGAQSMNDAELKLLGRLHRAEDVIKAFDDAHLAGFENISADVMFGIPDGTRESLAATLSALCDLTPTHISVYGLQIEEGTYFARHLDELDLPDEETERAMYMDTVAYLAKRGFDRYEISNFSQEGYPSRHNLKYWHREDYLGLGLAAHSCLGNTRFSNTENLEEYLLGNRQDTTQRISPHDILCETVMLGMRLDEGVDFSTLTKRYGAEAVAIRDALDKFTKSGLVINNGDRLFFGSEGMYVSNAILGQVLDFDG